MQIQDTGIHSDKFEVDEQFAIKPSFRIFSRHSGNSGWAEFFESKPTITYPRRTAIISQGEENPNIFYIVRGLGEYTNIDENGSENILEILGPGNMMNLQSVFGHNPSHATFSALSECIIASAGKNEVMQMMRDDDALVSEMFEEMAFIIGGLSRRFTMGAERSDVRTIRVLQMIATIHRDVYKEKDPIYIHLSQSDLARIIHTTRVTISKILTELKRKDVIKTDYGGIYIINMELLNNMLKCNGSNKAPTP